MKYKITYRAYAGSCGDSALLEEFMLEIGAQAFKIENGFVTIWTRHDKKQHFDMIINANDVLIIERIGEEKE